MKRSVLVCAVGIAFASLPSVTQAETIDALGVRPPGQSGYVSITGVPSGTGSDHLTAGATPELEFFDRGTWNQSIAMGD